MTKYFPDIPDQDGADADPALLALLDNSETQIDHSHPGGDPGSSMCEAPLGLV